MKMGTLDLRRDKKTLGREAEQQHSSMRRTTLVQQIEMGQQLKSGCIFLKRKAAQQSRPADKANHRLCIKVSQRCVRAYCRIKRPGTNQLQIFKRLHKSSINTNKQFGTGHKAPPYQLTARPLNQLPDFGMPGLSLRAFQKNQPCFVVQGCRIKFTFCWRKTISILISILVTEQSKIDIALFNFSEIKFISPAVSSRNILKQKRLKKPTHQGITTQIVTQYRPFSRELFLNAADENAERFHWG